MPQNILCLFPQFMFSSLVEYLDSAISINIPFGTISYSIFPAAKIARAFTAASPFLQLFAKDRLLC